ncbi:hypothetical protein DFH09DRAFT_888815, partial [Mycena vulgaris]
ARASGRTGLAILLVEPSAYGIDLAEGVLAKGGATKGRKKKPEKEKESDAEKKRKAQKRKQHAKLRGVNRGAAGGKFDVVFVKDTPPLDPEAADEGLLVFAQAGECRRMVLTAVYGNKAPIPRQSAIKRGEINRDVQMELHKWRVKIRDRDYPTALYSASAVLRDETIALLASVGPFTSKKHLEIVLAGQWTWWEEYGEELYGCLVAQTIPPMVPLPKKSRGKK